MMRRKRASSGGGILGDIKEQYFSPKRPTPSKAQEAAMGNFEPQYPESLSSFADGLRSDIMEILGSSASILNKSISIIFPFAAQEQYEQFEDSIHEVDSNGTQKLNEARVIRQSEEVLRMRCPSTWNEKKKNPQSAKTQRGGKVLLDKLSKNASIMAFVCGNLDDITSDHLLIVGNLRMILAKKNHDQYNSATILWSQPFRDIASCAVNCALSSEAGAGPSAAVCKLDISNRRGEVHTVPLQDARECVQVMMIIQTRCASPATSSSASSGSSTSSAAAAVSTPSISSAASNLMSGGAADMSPLAIGSSPITAKGGNSKSRRGAKRITSSSIHKENTVNSQRFAEEEGSSEEEGPDESPKKKVRLSPRKGLSQRPSHSSPQTSHRPDAMEEINEQKFNKSDRPMDMRQKMLQEVMLKKSKKDTEPPENEATTTTVKEEPATPSTGGHLNKYKVMLKSGVPQQAVLQKMTLEGISEQERNEVLGIKVPETPADDKAHLKKYMVMIKSGIPAAAVKQKMTMEGVSQADQDIVITPSENAVEVPATPVEVVEESQTVGFHWEPLKAEHEEHMKNSIWGELHSTSLELHQDEFSSLSSLFAKKSSVPVTDGNASEVGDSVSKLQKQTSRKGSMPKAIDMSRSTNISIGLSAFRQRKLSVDQVADAIATMDTESLSQEDLLRLREMLPTDNEIRSLNVVSDEDMHDSEKWLRTLGSIPTVAIKVQSMVFMSTFDVSLAGVQDNLTLVSSCIETILSSAGLKEVLRCVLTIGNTMNKGTWKGGAKGFRLVSLARLSHTKSTDGKSTIMNYLVQLLHTRHETNSDTGAFAALQLDEELGSIRLAKNISVPDVKREVGQLRRYLTDMEKEVASSYPCDNEKKVALVAFLGHADVSVKRLEQDLDRLLILCENMRNFFGEDADSSVGQMMDLMSEFVVGFANAKSALKRSIQVEARKRRLQK